MVKDIKGAVATVTSDTWFPRLKNDAIFKVTSNIDKNYNCIAFSMRLGDRWVDPKSTAGHWWPLEISSTSMLKDELIKAFEALRFKKCNDARKEFWYDKVSLYYHPVTGTWTHAARIITPKEYHSKLGEGWDIHHSNGSVLHNPKHPDSSYGIEFQYMKRHKLFRFYSLWLMLSRFGANIEHSLF